MSVQNVFGLLLLFVSKRLKRLSERLGTMDTGQVPTRLTTNKVLIWDVIEGPFRREDFDEDELFNEGIPDHLNFMLFVRIEDEGVIDTVNFWYDTEEEVYEVVKHFKSKIEPLEVT